VGGPLVGCVPHLAGSDVAGITTTATRTTDNYNDNDDNDDHDTNGEIYIVNGTKKWITNGIFADYCTAVVRTGGSGRTGISALIIPMKTEGVTCRKLENSGVNASGKFLNSIPSQKKFFLLHFPCPHPSLLHFFWGAFYF